MFAKVLVTLSFVLAWGLVSAQTPPPTNGPGNQNPPSTPAPNPAAKKDDTIERIRAELTRQQKASRQTDGFDQIGEISVRAGTKIMFRAVARIRGQQLNYAMESGPADAAFDPMTGAFTWTPVIPGIYSFELVASAKTDPTLATRTRVTIIVTKPLDHFGYDFFDAPRAALRARMEAASRPAGLPNLTAPPMGEASSGNSTSNGVGTPPGSGGSTNTETTQGQTNGSNPPGQGPPVNTTELNKTTNLPLGFQPPLPSTNFQNANTAEALRYLVGPFDMLGSNVFVPAPDRYQLGAGDTLEIRYSAPTVEAQTFSTKVDAQGRITLPGVGQRLVVRGQTLAQAEKLILRRLQGAFRDVEVTVSLKELRAMNISVLGDAFMPGSYQVPAVATLFNVLYMFGGPRETGSLRRIELRRTNGTKRVFDLYQFLIFGDASQDVPLQPGDTIFIPTVERRATVDGEVGRPAIYEVLPGENLRGVLKLAGGVKESGVSQRISHSTVDPGQGLLLKDIDLKSNANPPVFGNDRISVNSVRQVLTNVVSIEGAIDQPGDYALGEGLTVRGLLTRARGVVQGAYMERADLLRVNEDETTTLISFNVTKALAGDPEHDRALKVYDRIRVYKFDEVVWLADRVVKVEGAVRRPGDYPRSDKMTIVDLLLQSGGLTGEAFQEQGFLQRFNQDGTAGELLRVDFRKAAVGDPQHNLELRDRDELRVQTVDQARFVPDQQVKILGAVLRAGDYPSSANLTLKDLLDLAGGPMPNAAEFVEIAKSRVPENTPHERYRLTDVIAGRVNVPLTAGDLVTVPSDGNFRTTPRTVVVLGAVKNPGPYTINGTTDRISDLVERAGGVLPSAFERGAQFFRNPAKMQTLAVQRLTPRVKEVLQIISEDQYQRAVAKAEVEKARVTRSVNAGAPTIPIPGLTGATTSSDAGPVVPIAIQGTPVSRARPLDQQDLEPGGNLNVNLESALAKRGSRDDILVEDGDIVIVPETPSTVSVVGAVAVPSSLLFEPGKDVRFYVQRSGDLMPDAATNSILIFRANGQVIKANARTRVELGDRIWIPTKVMAERLSDRQAEIDAIARNITSAGLLFAIFRALTGR